MSPVKNAGSVASLKRAVGSAPERRDTSAAAVLAQPPVRTKPVRVTLNLPPALFRQLTRWADWAAEATGQPRVSVQDALRAMVAAGAADQSPSSPVLAELIREAQS